MKINVAKIANGYLVYPEKNSEAALHAKSIDEVAVRLKVFFGEMQAPEMTFEMQKLREKK